MEPCSWSDCPAGVRAQVDGLVAALREALGETLEAVYLHGSLAMGCFSPAASDLDLLVVTSERMDLRRRRAAAEALLRHSGAPSPVEISFMARAQLAPWRHPAPFDMHYSEEWRAQTAADLASGAWQTWGESEPRDYDLAAHCTVVLARGLALYGPAPGALIPPVPPADYLDSIGRDMAWGAERIGENPVYLVLNACRTLAYQQGGRVLSKAEGGAWWLAEQPDHRAVVAAALASYRAGASGLPGLDPGQLEAFAADVPARIAAAAPPRQ